MVRIKVVHASHLLLALVVALLVIVVVIVGIHLLRGGAREASIRLGATQMVEREEAAAVFAAASSAPREVVFGEADENEHTDAHADGFDVVILPRPDAGSGPGVDRVSTGAPASGAGPVSGVSPAPASDPGRGEEPSPSPSSAAGKRVLIYHTHTHEAYQQVDGDPYVESEPWRTTDPEHSVVRVGEELAGLLRGLGLTVVHDVTDHEPPKLGTAYVRSLETLEKYKDEPFDLYIDLHRDAYDEAIIPVRAVRLNGADAAQLMVLIGNGEGFDEKPDTRLNLMFARALTDRVNAMADGLMRPVMVKTGRYNQHVGTPAILIEVGHNCNTLKEALASMPILARAVAEQMS